MDLYGRERGSKALVFNGDFHWFDIDPRDFAQVNHAALEVHATRGNVETELAAASAAAGCGCGYPDWVGEQTVERSNRILRQLKATACAFPEAVQRLSQLPMHLRVDVGDARVAVVHGDADSLAGWGFSQEALMQPEGRRAAAAVFEHADVDVFASSHTCLPVLQRFAGARVLVNNGAAGMPNFEGELFGLATRVALSPAADSVHRTRIGEVFIEAIALRYDTRAWERRFLAQWPAGSDAHASYYRRIVSGPDYSRDQALRVSA